MFHRARCVGLAIAALVSGPQYKSFGQERPERSKAWSIQEAHDALSQRPRDPYLQFVVAQLSSIDGQPVFQERPDDAGFQRRQMAANRFEAVDLFSIFSGSLAIQESLQLDALTRSSSYSNEEPKIPTNTLRGPTVQSHPWKSMLAGRQPALSALDKCVPSDHLYVRIPSAKKLLQLQSLADDYAVYVTSQNDQQAYSTGIIDQLKRQLAIEMTDRLIPVYDAAVAEIAIASSDLFFREGADVTLILRLNDGVSVRTEMDRMLESAANNCRDAVKEQGEILGVPFKHVRSPDRSVFVFTAYPKPDIHVRTNSRVALERVLGATLQKPVGGKAIERLSDTDEFRYIRTLMPLGAAEEDGFVYMSDPFIRKMIGPEKKLTQRARLQCNVHLQMIAYAGLLHQTQHGRRAGSIDELYGSGFLGDRHRNHKLNCPCGGQYRLASDGIRGQCSHHGTLHSLVPCCDIPRTTVTDIEKSEYEQFEKAYSQYWRTFFDPIAIRLKQTSNQTRVETIILPLINNSIYQGLAATLGGKLENLDQLPVPNRNIFSIGLRVEKERMLTNFGIPPGTLHPNVDANDNQHSPLKVANSMRKIGLAMHSFVDTYRHFPPTPVKAPSPNGKGVPNLSWRVHLLPYLGEEKLFSQFKLDEPWDSPNNRALIHRMPPIFAAADPASAQQGKTRFVRPFHSEAIYSSKQRGTSFREITDGLTNTILLLVADEDQSVVWTRPDDLEIDMQQPLKGWEQGIHSELIVLLADGSLLPLQRSTSHDQIRALLSRGGGEVVSVARPVNANNPSRTDFIASLPWVEALDVPRVLYRGLGNQIGLHVCDADPLVDFSVARFLGMVGGSFNGRSNMLFNQSSVYAVLAMALNVPIYISAPVQDAAEVDAFLLRFDQFMATTSRELTQSMSRFLRIEHDFYLASPDPEHKVRAYAFHVGPLTWRFYWARIGEGFYIASKPFIIEELFRATHQAGAEPRTAQKTTTSPSHGLVRVRPEHWNQAKDHYRIGWSESERRACLNNLGRISDLARANSKAGARRSWQAELNEFARPVFRAEYRCPCGGHYEVDDDGTTICSEHGSLRFPKQPGAQTNSNLLRLTDSLKDVQLNLNFLDDGLHCIFVIERK